MIFNEVVYVAVNKAWVLFGIILTLVVLHIVLGIAMAVLEKMTEKKKQELEELRQQCLEKGLKVDCENVE